MFWEGASGTSQTPPVFSPQYQVRKVAIFSNLVSMRVEFKICAFVLQKVFQNLSISISNDFTIGFLILSSICWYFRKKHFFLVKFRLQRGHRTDWELRIFPRKNLIFTKYRQISLRIENPMVKSFELLIERFWITFSNSKGNILNSTLIDTKKLAYEPGTQGRDFPANFELAEYDTSESVWDVFCENEVEMWTLEQNVSTKSQKVAGMRFVQRNLVFMWSQTFEIVGLRA